MKKSFIPQMLCITTIFLALISLILILFGFGMMWLASQKHNVYAQGSHYVLRITSEYGIRGLQDIKTDRERSLYQTILWMNDRCATMVNLGYMQGRISMVSGIGLLVFTLLNGMIWWKLRACKGAQGNSVIEKPNKIEIKNEK